MLEIRNLSFEVEGKKILNDISLQFTENALTVITGPNGGGNSTLAKLIMGIEKPTAGAILLDGKDIMWDCAPAIISTAMWMPHCPVEK